MHYAGRSLAEAAASEYARLERAEFCATVAAGLSEWGAGDRHEVQLATEKLLRDSSDAELAQLQKRLAETGGTWGFHASDPTARRISRLAHSFVLLPSSGLAGTENLASAATRPVFLVANHLSYV